MLHKAHEIWNALAVLEMELTTDKNKTLVEAIKESASLVNKATEDRYSKPLNKVREERERMVWELSEREKKIIEELNNDS